jgi:hypothetical protein
MRVGSTIRDDPISIPSRPECERGNFCAWKQLDSVVYGLLDLTPFSYSKIWILRSDGSESYDVNASIFSVLLTNMSDVSYINIQVLAAVIWIFDYQMW